MPDLLTIAEAHVDALPLGERRSLLLRWADRIERRGEALARLITAAVDKPITLARTEVARALITLRGTADACRLLEPATLALDGAGSATLHRVPIGPVLAVTPFNFPLNLALHKLAPAIAAGAAAVWAPSPKAPGVAEAALELLRDAGAEPGLVQRCHDREAVAAMAGDPRLGLLSFTGSTEVGMRLRERTTHARAVLELGSASAVILEQVADPAAVAARVAWGASAFAGQVCIKVQRIFVSEQRDDLVAALAAAFAAIRCGPAEDPATVCGPLIDEAAAQRVRGLLARLDASSAVRLAGGTWQGRILAPTLYDRVPAHLPLAHSEEFFAPIAVIHRYADADAALDGVELSPFGISAGIYAADPALIARAFARLRVGTLVVGDIPTRRDDRLPAGGMKRSGRGREGTLDTVLDYTETKVLWRP